MAGEVVAAVVEVVETVTGVALTQGSRFYPPIFFSYFFAPFLLRIFCVFNSWNGIVEALNVTNVVLLLLLVVMIVVAVVVIIEGDMAIVVGVDLITMMEEEVMAITVIGELTMLVEVGEATKVVKAEAEVHRQS